MKPQKILVGVILAIYMQFGYYALCEAETLAKKYGEKLTKQIAADYKGEWKLVIGADKRSPIVLLEDGKTKRLSPTAKLGYQDKMLPIAAKIEVLDKVMRRTGGGVPSFNLNFVCDQNLDDLYFVVMLGHTRSKKVTTIFVEEIGTVKAGEIHKAYFTFNFSSESRNPGIMFYHKGLEVKADWRKTRKK